ncbi:Mitogen-activated protein kinase 12 (AtMPK12) (MAP kinase 12) [Durusdinium trenchii]|uniref:Mitogen-activated protein kinase 12 (AtMPK12) (MAP kinase 12) n=1 Tax=Durusdinium trenchii TaxID=1381693 RepID=A0ABP0HPS2_9DINO
MRPSTTSSLNTWLSVHGIAPNVQVTNVEHRKGWGRALASQMKEPEMVAVLFRKVPCCFRTAEKLFNEYSFLKEAKSVHTINVMDLFVSPGVTRTDVREFRGASPQPKLRTERVLWHKLFTEFCEGLGQSAEIEGDPDGADMQGDIYSVFEHMDLSLAMMLRRFHKLPSRLDICDYILYGVVRGLQYIHSARVAHGDLCPENVWNNNDDVKLAGFQHMHPTEPSESWHWQPLEFFDFSLKSIPFTAPEVLRGACFGGAAADLWGVGGMLGHFLMGRPVFPNASSCAEQLELHEQLELPEVEGRPDGCAVQQEMLRGLLQAEPHRRGSAVDLLHSEWFAKLAEGCKDYRAEVYSIRAFDSIGSLQEAFLTLGLDRPGAE